MTIADASPYVPPLRLYVGDDLDAGRPVRLSADQAHYLQHVMRRKAGDALALFNGRDGEWAAIIDGFGKGWCAVTAHSRLRPQAAGPDVWLLFAPVKRARLDFMVEKAVELGASAIMPVITRFTNVERVKEERLAANAVEAAEQCGRLDIPAVASPQPLAKVLQDWPQGRTLYFCDEAGDAQSLAAAVAKSAPRIPAAILIGPEGGFHPTERQQLRGMTAVKPVTLGPRILRSETAAIAALAIWQAVAGDW